MRFVVKTIKADRQTLLAVFLLLFCGTLWGASPMLSKLAAGVDAHPIGLSLMVNSMGAVVCGLLCMFRKVLRWPTRGEWHFFFCWAILYSVLNQVLIYWLSARLDAALVSIFTVLEGLVIFAAAALLRLEKPDVMRCGGLLVGLFGVVVLLLTAHHGESAMPSLFMFVGLMIPMSYAAESIFIAARRPASVDPLFAVALVMLCSLPFLLVLTTFNHDFMPLQFPPGRGEILALALMLSTVLANLAFFVLIKKAGSVFAGQLCYVNAVCGIAWGVVVLGEKMPWGMFVAVGFIMLGLLLVRPKSEVELSTRQGAEPWPAE
jgi:drug/metabolite transporter (DMT)-like permease